MNETSEGGNAFKISIGLAFVGAYADASSYLLARTFTGHLTGNCVLAAVSERSYTLTGPIALELTYVLRVTPINIFRS
jgi:uncharacterized membrane protein YoaK (UPF0700 family)